MSQATGLSTLKDSTRQDLEAILDTIAEGILTLDHERRVTGINRAACEILEVPRQEALETDCRALLGERFCAQAAAVRDSIERCEPVENVLSRLQTPAGGKKVLNFRTHVFRGADGRPRGSVVVFRDVTELVSLKEQWERLCRLRPIAEPAAATPLAAPGPARAEDEREVLRRTLESTGWNVAKAARRLNISRTTLYERIDRYALSRPKE